METGHVPDSHDPGAQAVPLVVDLDGTLVRTNLLLESVFMLARQHPARILQLPLWLARGRAHFKQQLAKATRFPSNGFLEGRTTAPL